MGGHDHILHSNFVNGLLTQKSGVDFKSFTHLEIELGPFSDEKTNSILSDSGVHSQNTIIGNAQWKDLASQRFYCQRNNKQLLITVNKIEVTDSDPEDADTKSKVQGFIDQVEEEFKEPALKILRDYDTKFSTIRTRETPLIIFFAQLIANWGGFDIGLIQSGHIRRDKILTAGSILTLKDCFQIVPITDNIVGNFLPTNPPRHRDYRATSYRRSQKVLIQDPRPRRWVCQPSRADCSIRFSQTQS